MTPFEYLLALVSILVGLAVADLATSLHYLLRARNRVTWDWLTPASALLVVLLVLNFWWGFYRIGRVEIWTRYWAFLVLASLLVSMFLLASAALPDGVPEEGLDLRAYYEENQRYFWILFAVFTGLASLMYFLAAAQRAGIGRWAVTALPNVLFTALFLSLAFIRKRGYHMVLVPLLLAFLALQWSALRLV